MFLPLPIDTIQQIGSYRNLVISEAEIPKLKSNEVLVKIHAVSLQVRRRNPCQCSQFTPKRLCSSVISSLRTAHILSGKVLGYLIKN